MDVAKWPELKRKLSQLFKTKTREEWCAIMEGTDICFAPVLDMDEAPKHPHNQARETFIEIDGVIQPARRRDLAVLRQKCRDLHL